VEEERVAGLGVLLGGGEALVRVVGRAGTGGVAVGVGVAGHDVVRRTVLGRDGLGNRSRRERLRRLAAVGVIQGQLQLVCRVRLEEQDAAGEEPRAVGQVQLRAVLLVLVLALLHAEQRRTLPPRAPAGLAVVDADGGVLVVVAADDPVRPQAVQRRRVQHRLAGR
jgi:hypothetical protein